MEKKISMADIVLSCSKINPTAKDRDLTDITWNKSLKEKILSLKIEKIFFTSKWVFDNFSENIFPDYPLEAIILPSPSQAANLALARTSEYKLWKSKNPDLKTLDFRIEKYRILFDQI